MSVNSGSDNSDSDSESEILFDDSQDLDDYESTAFPNGPMASLDVEELAADSNTFKSSEIGVALTANEQRIVDKLVETISVGDKQFSLLSTIRYDPVPRRPIPSDSTKKLAAAIYPGAGRHLTSDDEDDENDENAEQEGQEAGERENRQRKARDITEANFLLLRTHWRRLQYSIGFFRWNMSVGFGHLLNELKSTITENNLDTNKSYKMRVLVSPDGTMKVEAIEIPLKPQLNYGLVPHVKPRYKVYLDDKFSFVGPFTSFKTTYRDHYNEARAKYITDPSGEEVVLHNSRGEVTEGTVTNVAFQLYGYWITPSLTSGCLCGVARHYLVTRGYIREGVIPFDSIRPGDPVLLFNAIMGVELGEVVERR